MVRIIEALAPLETADRLCLPHEPSDADPHWHLFHFTVTSEAERDHCLRFLRERGVGAAFHFVPLHSSPHGRRLAGGAPPELPVTDRVSRTLIRLPLYPQLAEAELAHVVQPVQAFFAAADTVTAARRAGTRRRAAPARPASSHLDGVAVPAAD